MAQGRSLASKGLGPSGQAKRKGQLCEQAWWAYLADLLGEQQQLGQPYVVPGQVVSEAAQRHVLHDELDRFLA